jgi:hypothetical protein
MTLGRMRIDMLPMSACVAAAKGRERQLAAVWIMTRCNDITLSLCAFFWGLVPQSGTRCTAGHQLDVADIASRRLHEIVDCSA